MDINICVVGSGIGRIHTDCYKQLGYLPVAICDIDEERGKKHVEDFGIKKFYKNFEDAIADPTINVIDVCTPNYLHVPMVIAALKAGKHVCCEKPMSINGAEAAKVIDAIKGTDLKLLMAFCYRFRPDLQYIKKQIENNVLGNILFSKVSLFRQHGIPGMGSWFTTKELSGGGAIADIGVHFIDLAHWLVGMPKVKTVSAYTSDAFGKRGLCGSAWGVTVPGGPFDVDDLACGQLRYEDGTLMQFETSWAAHTKDTASCTILGDKGGLIWELDGGKVTFFSMDGDIHVETTPKLENIHGHITELDHFINCIKNNKQCDCSVSDGVEMMRVIDALYKSTKTNKEEEVVY